MKKVLTIAGSDSCGGAGIQADLKTFSAHQVYGMSVITAVTAQNTQGVLAVEDISPEVVREQIDAIFQDIAVDAVKIGMVSKIPIIITIAERLRYYQPKNIVLDPVMISKSGFDLLRPDAKKILIEKLLPLATIVTPNIPEAEQITEISIQNLSDMEKAARLIYDRGAKNVLIKGGHLKTDATDLLFDGQQIQLLKTERILTKNTHGTGCTLSSALAANLAKGDDIKRSVQLAKEYITIAIQHAFQLGHGIGPTHHFYSLYQKAGLLRDPICSYQEVD